MGCVLETNQSVLFVVLVLVFALLVFLLFFLGGACVCVCLCVCVCARTRAVCVRALTHARTHKDTQIIEKQTGREPSATFGVQDGLAHLNQQIDVYRRCLHEGARESAGERGKR